ncbi:TM7S3/TM198-like domain-containing protein [Phytoactinopolyspora halotolerans]|uniref:TMEM198/TM7SF3 family protein n=1 Tax=Phytoactinopolyspora halotolerans TaxID=1981512 RepID=A0A6L9SIZ3_9ACTN|nr:DUF4203 domain-containing protein [Phytoactinopolyspora halotolerans]NEE04382.1 TMEM198/TM7SF3 family protein [Phytoactinopolyspora halotolerans]
MTEIILGLLAVAVGVFLCLRGQWAMRILLAIWGAFVGFATGAGLVDSLTDQGYLASALGWIVAILVGALFASLAYLFFAVSIILGMASMGFVLGGALASALGVDEPWSLLLIGALGGVALAGFAIAANLPQLLLIVISAFAGASVTIAGLMLIFDVIDADNIIDAEATAGEHSLWYAGGIVLAAVGIFVQLRQAGAIRRTVRETWSQPAS